MSSVSKDTSESSLVRMGKQADNPSQKAKDKESAILDLTDKHFL